MRETIAVLSDSVVTRAHQEGQPALLDGDVLTPEKLAEAMISTALRAGKPLGPPLSPTYSARRGD